MRTFPVTFNRYTSQEVSAYRDIERVLIESVTLPCTSTKVVEQFDNDGASIQEVSIRIMYVARDLTDYITVGDEFIYGGTTYSIIEVENHDNSWHETRLPWWFGSRVEGRATDGVYEQ